MNRPVFVGIEIRQSIKEQIISWWKQNVGSELHENLFCHHITLEFKPKETSPVMKLVGTSILFKIAGVLEDENCQTIVVKLDDKIPYKGTSMPHITIATNGSTPPKYSNQLINESFMIPFDGPYLSGLAKGF